MCWLPIKGADQTKVLHLKLNDSDPWKPYTSFPQLAVVDYNIPKGSRGWSTYQRLREAGWELVPSPDTEEKNAPVASDWDDIYGQLER